MKESSKCLEQAVSIQGIMKCGKADSESKRKQGNLSKQTVSIQVNKEIWNSRDGFSRKSERKAVNPHV